MSATRGRQQVTAAVDFAQIGRSCLCLHARMTARLLTRHYNAALAPAALEVTEFSLLAALSLRQDESITQLAQRLSFERTTLVRSLKRLEGRGLIAPASNAGRSVRYELTAAGSKALSRAEPLWRTAQHKVEAQLEVDADRILAALSALRSATPPETL